MHMHTHTHMHEQTHTLTKDTGKPWFIHSHIHIPWPGRKLGILYHRQDEHSPHVIYVGSALTLFWWIAQIRKKRTKMCVRACVHAEIFPERKKKQSWSWSWGYRWEVRAVEVSVWDVHFVMAWQICSARHMGGWLFSGGLVPRCLIMWCKAKTQK